MPDKLPDDVIASAIEGTGWSREGDTIVRDLKLDDFRAAMSYVDQVAELAEAANHHPDILIHGFNKVRLTLSTHSEGGLTRNDLDLAGQIDELPTVSGL